MEVLYQPFCFLSMLYFGIVGGVIYEIVYLISKSFKKVKIIKIILDFSWAICAGLIFFFGLNYLYFGQFRLYLLFSFIIGVFAERKLLGFYVDKIFIYIYNLVKIFIDRIKNLNLFKRCKVKRGDTKRN